MDELEAVYTKEVRRSLDFFHGYDRRGLSQTIHAPFHEVEAGYRSGQMLVMSELMRQAGRVSLDGMRILDFGCGSGRVLRSFIDMGASQADLFGVDINQERVAAQINFAVFNGWKLDFPDAHFDLVTQFVVFSSIAAPELRQQLALEMVRVLKPGGFVFWWDFFRLVGAAGVRSDVRLDPVSLFRGLPGRIRKHGVHPKPSECIRPLRGLRRAIGPLVDLFSFRETHVAALMGPKRDS
jgi:SAM-dependent methyltransferase